MPQNRSFSPVIPVFTPGVAPLPVKLLKVLVLLLLTLSLAAHGQTGSGGTYSNPVIRGFNPDPSICRVGEDFYLITSSSYLYPGVPVYHSRDLANWKLTGHCLTRPEHYFLDKNNNKPEIYAGTLRYHNNTFYMVTTDVSGGGNFYVTATRPEGPWSDPVCIDRPVFDPSLFFDDDGKVYYTRRGEFSDKDILQAEIDIKTGSLLTPLRSISKGLVGDDTEGPHLFKAHGWYYLTMGEGGSRYLHMQSIARSKSPWGPFEPCPWNPVISQHNGWWHHSAALGHADFIQDHLGNWWAVCLGQRKAGYMDFCVIGRETFLFPVEWQDGWPKVNPGHMTNLDIKASLLPLKPWPEIPARDSFNQKELALHWNLMAYPLEKVYSLADRPGYLRLYGTAESVRQSRQVSFIGRRQEEMNGEITALMEFHPTSPNEEAGLTVYQNANHQYALCITMRDGQRVALLRKRVGDMSMEIQGRKYRADNSGEKADGPGNEGTGEGEGIRIRGDKVRLRVSFDSDFYRFYIAEDEDEWLEVGSGLVNLISTDVAGTFGGVVMGPYASGNGMACSGPADFDWVEAVFKDLHAQLSSKYLDNRPEAGCRMDAVDAGVVMAYGDGPDSCDYLGAREAIVTRDRDTFYLFYDGAGPKGWLACLATSTDLVTWKKSGKILDFGQPGEPDQAGACAPWIIRDNGFWHMFYLGTPNASPAPDYVPMFPYLTLKAKSRRISGPWMKQPDILPFKPEPNSFYSATSSPGFIIKHKNEFLMYYSASDFTVKRTLGIARTKNLDGPWKIDPGPIVPPEEQIENSSVYFEAANQTWFLFTNHIGLDADGEYTDAVWVYWSKDPEKWNPDHKAIVLDGVNCKWSQRCIGMPSVIQHNGRLAILYDAPGGNSVSHMPRSIGLAWLNLPLAVPGE